MRLCAKSFISFDISSIHENGIHTNVTKNNAGRSARFLPLFKSDMVVPDIYARYGGTTGRTQGLRKLITPATSATNKAGNRPASMISIPNMAQR